MGAADPLLPKSGWELQPEESLIIPSVASRATEGWKRPASQEDVEILGIVRTAVARWEHGVRRIKDPGKKKEAIELMRKAVQKASGESDKPE